MTPYESVWRAPGVAARWKGVVVYHTYKDDDMSANPPEWFWFTTDREGDSEDEHTFDVRELPTWVEPEHPPYLSPPEIKDKANWRVEYDAWQAKYDTPENRKAWEVFHAKTQPAAIRRAIRAAIDRGIVTQKGVLPPPKPTGLPLPDLPLPEVGPAP